MNHVRCFVAAAMLLLCMPSFAAPALPPTLSFNFDRVPVVQFIEATYRAILGEQYVIDPRLVDDAQKITIQVRDLPSDNLRPFLSDLLRSAGIATEDRNGITFFAPARVAALPPSDVTTGPVPPLSAASLPTSSDEDQAVEIYAPRYRSATHLQTIANSLLSTSFSASDSVILRGKEQRVRRVQELLDRYDTRPGEVLVRAALYEFADTGNDGMNVQAALAAVAGKLNVSVGPAALLQNFVSFRNTSIQAFFSAVSGDTRFQLVSAPTLRVRHSTKARLTVGTETPVLDAVRLDKNGEPLQSVTYRPSGVILELTPTIMADRIELDVRQEVSSFAKTSTSEINSPTLLKRSVQTVVGVDAGELIVLGGLDEDKTTDSSSGFPFLPSWTRSRTSDKSHTQILLVMEVTRI